MRPQRIVVLVLVLLAGAFLGWRALAPRFEQAEVLSGYIEGDPLYLASPIAGTVQEIAVHRGERVTAGQRLFAIDPGQLQARRDQAAAALAAAEANAADVRKGQRPVELAVLRAQRTAAEARRQQAQAELARVEPLVRNGTYAAARLTDARAASKTADADVRAAEKRLETAELGAREEQIAMADARVQEAKAALAEAEANLAELAPPAPAAGIIDDVFFQPREWAAANQPIVALIPDSEVFVRFFVPETEVAAYRPGVTVQFSCDGCPAGMKAVVARVSPRPEFTPPIIYSRATRDRLVFMVEARPEDGARLVPGIPVDVTPIREGPG